MASSDKFNFKYWSTLKHIRATWSGVWHLFLKASLVVDHLLFKILGVVWAMCESSSGPLLSESGNVLQCEQCLVDSLQHPQLKCRWQFQTQIVRLYVLNLSTHFDQIFLSAQKFRLQFSNNSPNIVNPNQSKGLLCFSGKTRSWLFFFAQPYAQIYFTAIFT